MTIALRKITGCDLHVHLGGCLFAEDLLELGREIYEQVDWGLFVHSYEQAFGLCPDPIACFREALRGTPAGMKQFEKLYVFTEADSGDFARFQAKFNFLICLYRYWWRVLQREEEIVWRILERHRAEGLDYVEYRAMYGYGKEDPEGFLHFHRLNAQVMQQASRPDFIARYIISLPRQEPLQEYALVQRLLSENPELIPAIVGVDFCFLEEGFPPRTAAPLFARVEQDNQQWPERALEVVYHVGEVFFEKSLESAVRWCHEAAVLGARRLGHAIALGLDPEVAISRIPRAHQRESVRERLDQIAYDLHYRDSLAEYGVRVDEPDLCQEREALLQRYPQEQTERPYSPQRLAEIRRRQTFVLDRLAALGTVIESCPTSNLRIGKVPDPALHPLHHFLKTRVNLVIGADDPGIFASPLAAEIDWVLAHTGLDAAGLMRRLGDPRCFRLGRRRPQ